MWGTKYRNIKYLGVAITSSFGAYVGIKSVIPVKEIKAEGGSLINREDEKSVLIVGAGVMGLGTAFHLAERGYDVTILEKADSVASLASRSNGALLCPSMCASWADIKFNKTFRGELKSLMVSWNTFLDPYFWGWSLWFLYNGLCPGRANTNHESHRNIGHYSLQCQKKIEEEFGDELPIDKVGENSIKLFYDSDIFEYFMKSEQVQFWKKRGHPFVKLTSEECKQHIPTLDDYSSRNIVGGVWNQPPVDGSAEIFPFCTNLEKKCLKLGVKIVTSCNVVKLIKEGDLILGVEAVQNKDSEVSVSKIYKATNYVLATGVDSYRIGKQVGITLPVYPLRGNLVTIPMNTDITEPLKYGIYSTGVGCVICPIPGDMLRVSSEVHAVGFDYSTSTKSCEVTLSKALKVLDSKYLKTDEATFQSALRPISGDDLPIVGQTIISNLFVNTGHGSKGWTLSFGSIRLLADIISKKETEIDAEPYSPKRFHPFRKYFC